MRAFIDDVESEVSPDPTPFVEIFLVGNSVFVEYGPTGKTITLDMKSEKHAATAEVVLSDINFWSNFLNSFSTAINTHVEG